MAILTQQRSSMNTGVDDDPVFHKDASTGEFPRVDNRNPEAYIDKLIPVAMSPISVKKLSKNERGSSQNLLELARMIGFEIQQLDFPIYGRNKQGKMRFLSNSELVQGYPMYGKSSENVIERLKREVRTMSMLKEFTKLLKSKAAEFSEPVKMDEWDDADRLTIQRTQYLGRFLNPPASSDLIGLKYPRRIFEILEIVCKHYIDLTESLLPNRVDVMTLITDAKETAIGAPSYASAGEDDLKRGYHEKRLITLADMPVPDYSIDPGDYLDDLYLWGEQLGMPDGSLALASAISYRQGAKGHKPQKLWYFNGHEYVADYEAMSWESNQRLVYPAPHCFNVLITPIVYQMKLARMTKLGMYHRPEYVVRYINQLNKQGLVSYESDFSSFDTTISSTLLQFVFRTLAKYAKKFAWEYGLFADYLQTTGVVAPSYLTDDPTQVTYFKGAASLLSGILPTSESGSIVSIAAQLYALEKQIPDIVNQWLSGKFVCLVQSDDVLFTLPKKINEENFSDAMHELGLTAKLKEGNMFLKKLLPVGTLSSYSSKFPLGGVPLWSRQPQQTFFNEHSYEGKPDAIVRLALLSRAEGLNKHPMFDSQLDKAWKDILVQHDIFKDVIPHLYDGVLSLNDEDKQAVLEYSTSDEGMAWVSQIYNRAESDPKAKQTLLELSKIGFNLDEYDDTAVSQRRSYLKALYTHPNADSRAMLTQISAWNLVT